MGRPQLDHLEGALDAVRTAEVAGDLVECGTGRGGGAIFMRAYLDAHELPDRRVWVADPFRSSPEPAPGPTLRSGGVAAFQADLNLVRDGFDRFGLLDDRVRFLQGAPADTLAAEDTGPIALLRIGRHLGAGTRCGARRSCTRGVGSGGVVVVDAPEGIRVTTSGGGVPAEPTRSTARSSRIDASALAWTVDAASADLAAPRPRRLAGGTPAARRHRPRGPDRPHRRRRRLQHAPRGRPHAALAVARVPGGRRRPSTTR